MKSFFVLILLALYVSANPTGIVNKPNGRIFNGIIAKEGQFPYQVMIPIFGTTCAGAILSQKWIITSGPCAVRSATVNAGSIYSSTKDPKRVIVQSDRVFNYKSAAGINNLALIELNTSLTFNSYIQPIRILKEDVKVGTVLRTSGWGANRYMGGPINNLHYVDLTAISAEECQMALPEFYDETRLCVNASSAITKQTCEGDRGNPLVLYNGTEPLLVGLERHHVEDCGYLNEASGFVRVNKYLDWIKRITGIEV